MTQSVDPGEFGKVEQTTDPERLVRYLREASALGGVQAMNDDLLQVLDVHDGHAVLDVGCGTGDEVRRLAPIVGPAGRVVGLDTETMIAAAREGDIPGNVEFVVGDAHSLPFEDSSFDRYRSHRVYMHLHDPATALAEATRVVRPGGAVVVYEPDWGTLALDADDPDLTSAVIDTIQRSMEQPWIGRRLPRLFREAGLVNVKLAPNFGLFPNLGMARDFLLDEAAERLVQTGAFGPARISAWLDDLARREAAGSFFFGGLTVLARGFKPDKRSLRSVATRLLSGRRPGT